MGRALAGTELRATAVRYVHGNDTLEIETNQGLFVIPRVDIDALANVHDGDLEALAVWPDGSAIEIDTHDIHISVDGLLGHRKCATARSSRHEHCRRIHSGRASADSSDQRLRYIEVTLVDIALATILNSPRALEMSVYVVRAFVQLRSLLASNQELARRFAQLEARLDKHDEAIAAILSAIRQLMNPPAPKRRGIGFTADLSEKS